MGTSRHDIRLGYLGFEVRDVEAWATFAVDVLGLAIGSRGNDGCFSLRCDDWAQRFAVSSGPADDIAFFGWEVDDAGALEAAAARLRSPGVDPAGGTDRPAPRARLPPASTLGA